MKIFSDPRKIRSKMLKVRKYMRFSLKFFKAKENCFKIEKEYGWSKQCNYKLIDNNNSILFCDFTSDFRQL